MSDINVNFTINQLNANLSIDPAPNVTLNIADPMTANFYIEGTTSGTVTQVGGNGSGLGFSLAGNVTSAGNLTLTTPTDIALRTTLNIGNVANINLNGNTSQVLAGDGTWVAQGGGGGNVILGSAITSNTVTVNTTSPVYLTTPLTLPDIVPGLSYKVSVRGTMVRTGTTASNAIIQLRCGNTGTVSDVDIGNVSIPINGPTVGTQRFSLDFLVTFRTATTVLVNSYYLEGPASASATPWNSFGTVVSVPNPSFLGISGALSVFTAASFVLTQAVITPYNIYPGNIAYGTGTVTSVSTSGSGLGFSLSGGPITTSGTVSLTTPSDTALRTSLNIGNVANINLNANSSTYLNGSGTWTAISNQLENIKYASEVVSIISHTSGTYSYNILDNSIVYSTSNAIGNVTLNFRGNSTVTLANTISAGRSITAVYLMTTGSTGYIPTSVQIDGVSQTIRYAANTSPSLIANTVCSYTYTLIKTADSPATWIVLGSQTRYG